MVKAYLGGTSESTAGRWRRERGVTSIEYALIASLIALAIVSAIGATGDANGLSWTDWVGKVVAAIEAALP